MAERLAEGRQILVVEDEMMIVLGIEQTLHDLGAHLIGPAARLDSALKLAKDAHIDAAILDVTIRGGNTYAVADILADRGVPFMFSTGYSEWALDDRHRGRPRLTKPFTGDELETQLLRLLTTHSA